MGARALQHRDIKPHNVFCMRSGGVKVLDFGIAVLREQGEQHEDATVSGMLLGTPSYMAPEQARGRWADVDRQTDIWAVGATMFMLLTGRHVHQADTTSELLIAAATQAAPSLAEFRADLPRSVIECVDGALKANKADRWSDARAMQRSLRAALTELARQRVFGGTLAADFESTASEPGSTFATPSAPPVPALRRVRRWVTVSAGSLVVGTVLAARSPHTAVSALHAGREQVPTGSTRHFPARAPEPASPLPRAAAKDAVVPRPAPTATSAPQSAKTPRKPRRFDPPEAEQSPAPVDTESALDRWN